MVTTLRNVRLMHVLERLAARFSEAGVPLIVLKGGALQLLLYRRPEERPMDDLDLLVRPRDVEKAQALLIEAGCLRGEELVREDFFPRFHYEMAYSYGRLCPVKIDLHVRPFRPLRYSRTVPDAAFWERAVAVPIGQSTVLVPEAGDMLIHLAVHAEVHGDSRPQWRMDVERFVEAFESSIDWGRVVATARAWDLVLPLRRALRRIRAESGPLCPGQVLRQLDRVHVGWRGRLALWQAPRDMDHPVRHVVVGALCTPGFRFSLAYLGAVLFPDAAHMEGWYGRNHRLWLLCAHGLRILWPVLRRVVPVWYRFSGIRTGKSAIHGTGVFAVRDIAAGKIITRYHGQPVEKKGPYVGRQEKQGDRRQYYEITGRLRFLNHSCRPNAKLDGFDLVALKPIVAGQEITIDYGPDACSCRKPPGGARAGVA
ncbi:MAG TPA: nucleotidyltransferase family protein [Phycisphaerae bacterium]|nr:nucleotidyltransferase family protein [Phycisphaerae bacterium]HRY69465.1 nucleotidyltransferase family protein [Phycisphaerae bacterium]HSA26332.1 nucleotidyltransferase family protein [Phycisphaerae bacterium]